VTGPPPGREIDLLGPRRYAQGYPWDEWARLRAEAPVCRIDHPNHEPYWAVTCHALVREVSSRPDVYTQQPTIQVKTRHSSGRVQEARTIVHMDLPEHRPYRRVAVGSFTPRSVAALEPTVRRIAGRILDRELGRHGRPGETVTLDFVETVAAWHPLAVISEVLGIPEADQADVLRWTNLVLAASDPEFRDGPDAAASINRATGEFLRYFTAMAADRRGCPRHDLATVLVEARIDGEPMPEFELLSYFVAVAVAGHDTTRNVLAGSLLALIERPEVRARLWADPGLWAVAAEELLRWTSVVVHFARTAAVDTELGGHAIAAGDRLALFYPSANRDDAVFERPDELDIDRTPNPHLAFGHGEHYCIGQALARLEVRVLFDELAARVDDLTLAGPVEHLATNFVSGVKHLPVRCRLR